jgi:hypothetical protein
MKPEVFELPDVNHGEIQTPIAPIVHPKMNSGRMPARQTLRVFLIYVLFQQERRVRLNKTSRELSIDLNL